MLLTGSLRVTTLPEILHSICISRETGILSLQEYSVTKKIYFEDGKITFAYSNQKKDTLGDILLRKGVITLEQYLSTSKKIQPGLKHGQILLQEGIISTQELIAALHTQIKEIIFSLFGWTEGSFHFEKDEKHKESIKLNISSADLILSGVKKINDWGVIAKVLGGIDTVLEPSTDMESKLADVQITDQEHDILNYAKNRPIREVLKYSLLKDFETARLLAGFVTVDLLRVRKLRHLTLEPLEGPEAEKIQRNMFIFNNVFRHNHETLKKQSGEMADSILRNYYQEVRLEENTLLHNIEMNPDGSLDPDLLDLNVMGLDIEDKSTYLLNVFFKILSTQMKAARELMGDEKKTLLEMDVKVLVEKLTAKQP